MRRRRRREKTIGYPEYKPWRFSLAFSYGPRLLGLVTAVGAIAVSHYWCETEFCRITTWIAAIAVGLFVALPLLWRLLRIP